MTTVADAPSSFPTRVATPETLDELEYHRAPNLVGARAVSPLGADAVRQQVPTANAAAVLRQVVADTLQVDARVRRFHIAPPEQGGAGATVVEFD